MKNTINYQQIYEEELSHTIRESLERPTRFYELSHPDRLQVEELVDIGYRRAIEDALDPEVLDDTAAMAAEMGSQLYTFANLLTAYLNEQNTEDEN